MSTFEVTHLDNPELEPTELLGHLRAGRTDLAPLVVSYFAGRLYSYVSKAFPVLSDFERETVCEKAVERAVTKIDRFDPERGSFDAWLRAFTRNEVADLMRSPRRELSTSFDLEPGSGAETETPTDVSEPVRTALAEALASLSALDQLIITLRTIELLDYRTIADRLGVSEASCRQRHRRALQRLSNHLGPLPSGTMNEKDGHGK